MGRQWRKKNRRNNKPKKSRDDDHRSNSGGNKPGKDYVKTCVENGNYKMEAYYAVQGLHNTRWNNDTNELVECVNDEEKQAERLRWRKSIGDILPTSFRINGDLPDNLRQHIEAELRSLLDKCPPSEDGGETEVVKKIGFLSGAYQLGLDKSAIRKRPGLEHLHEWLKRETQSGFISRQEIVSMIPPVVMDPSPCDYIIDMCAAPGSKTAQLLEKLGPDGCMLANDANSSRAHMLVSQLKRIMHNNPVCLITKCNAQSFPSGVVQYDKVLCDVPCSGDGTSRKNIGIWKSWNQMASWGLHSLQIDIAWKGAAQLLKVGGVMCYSTCSYNPGENEAVVAETLRKAEGSLELVDVKLEGFRTRPGMSTWKVFCENKSRKEMKEYHKKNNPKMVQKRKDYEESQKQKKEEVGEGQEEEMAVDGGSSKQQDATVPSEPELPAKASVAKSSTSGGPNDNDSNVELVADKERTYHRKFEPSTMEEGQLIEMVKSSGMEYFPTFDDVTEDKYKQRLKPSAFPPTEEEASKFHLERCIRCLPQDNDTGGFFIALLRKTSPIGRSDRKKVKAAVSESCMSPDAEPDVKRAKVEEDGSLKMEEGAGPSNSATDEAVAVASNNNEETDGKEVLTGGDDMDVDGGNDDNDSKSAINTRSHDSKPGDGRNTNPDSFVAVKDEILDPLIEFYGLDSSPTFRKDLYMSKACGEGANRKVIYYISKPIKQLIDLGIQEKVIVVNSGLRGFVRNNKECEVAYRIAQEGAHFLASHMSKRKFTVCKEDFMKCLSGQSLDFSSLSNELQKAIEPIETGAFLVLLQGYEEKYKSKMLLTMWRCRNEKIDCLVAKVELDAIRTKLKALQEVDIPEDGNDKPS